MNREEAPGKSPEEMYIQQKVRVLLMLKKMGSNVSMNSNRAKTSHTNLHIHKDTKHFVMACCSLGCMCPLSQLTPSEEAFLRNYAGVVHSQMSQLPQHNIDQGKHSLHTS